MRRLFFDLETSFLTVNCWRIGREVSLSHHNIVSSGKIICIGYRWQGGKTKVLTWDDKQDDKGILSEFISIAKEADEICGHNAAAFDMKWIRTRSILQGLEALPDIKISDTLKIARKYFKFNSNALDYLGSILGFGGKIHTDYGLWDKVVNNNNRLALGRMAQYCKKDVELSEQVWNKLQVIATPKTHAAVLSGGEDWNCPRCESKNVKISKTRMTATGTRQKQMQCAKCFGYYTISWKAFERYVEAKVE